jgi:predicted DCC family thiol-disulfide oxidoreductase YuxK
VQIVTINEISQRHPVVLYDGVCALCNGFIKWLLKRDTRDIFRFIPLQDIEQEPLPESARHLKTVVLIYQGQTYTKSAAAIRAGQLLGGRWKSISILKIFPLFIRNFVYDVIAKYRYKWFGRHDHCPLPEVRFRHKFLHILP